MSERNIAKEQKEYVPCKQCGKDEPQRLFTTWDMWAESDQVVKEKYTFVQCKYCGLVYLNPRVSAENIGNYYEGDYISHAKRPNPTQADKPTGLKGIISPKVRQTRQAVFNKLRTEVRPDIGLIEQFLFRTAPLTFSGQGLSLLDIGCGTGFDMMERKKLGWDVYGLEPSPQAVQICQDYDLQVQQGDLSTVTWEEDRFEVVTLYQVIEHFSELRENLDQIYRLLKPGGIVYITTPNWNSLPSWLFRKYWIGADTPRHYFLFSPKTLAAALSSANLVPKYWYTHSSTSEYTATIEFVLREKFGIKIKRDSIRKNRFLSYLTLPIARADGWLKLGGTLHMFAQKPVTKE